MSWLQNYFFFWCLILLFMGFDKVSELFIFFWAFFQIIHSLVDYICDDNLCSNLFAFPRQHDFSENCQEKLIFNDLLNFSHDRWRYLFLPRCFLSFRNSILLMFLFFEYRVDFNNGYEFLREFEESSGRFVLFKSIKDLESSSLLTDSLFSSVLSSISICSSSKCSFTENVANFWDRVDCKKG